VTFPAARGARQSAFGSDYSTRLAIAGFLGATRIQVCVLASGSADAILPS
jgi:hypothetical protein